MVTVAIAMVAVTACGKSEGAGSKTCPSPPVSIAAPSGGLAGFPKPTGVVYTTSSNAGPSTIAEGYADADLTTVYNSYASALGTAPYGVTKKEHDAHDAEVTFTGSGSTGQVRLGEACKGRTSVKITIRPGT
ncbi:MAG: hypothetical protein JWO37_3844 [Acidimicrobiales bacterium]|nr:hypothetical protein [Acidimicrobiales bacterium]